MPNFELLSYEQTKERLCSIPNTRDRVLLKTIYGGCARVGEIVKKRRIAPIWNERDCLQLDSLEIKSNALLLKIPTEKNPHAGLRIVPISRIDDDTQKYFKKSESWLTEDIISFFEADPRQLKYGNSINISTRWAETKFNKYFPEFNSHIHWLRHWRTTHLLQGNATGIPVPFHIVQRIGGWYNASVLSSTYTHLITQDYIDLH